MSQPNEPNSVAAFWAGLPSHGRTAVVAGVLAVMSTLGTLAIVLLIGITSGGNAEAAVCPALLCGSFPVLCFAVSGFTGIMAFVGGGEKPGYTPKVYTEKEPRSELPPAAEVVQAGPIGQTGFRCPFCSSSAGPRHHSKISTGGWIMFWMLLLFLCFPLCWIGLLMKDSYTTCRACGMKLGG